MGAAPSLAGAVARLRQGSRNAGETRLLGAALQGRDQVEIKAYDAWGDELGLTGAVFPEMKIWLTQIR